MKLVLVASALVIASFAQAAITLQIKSATNSVILSWTGQSGNNYTVQSASSPIGPWGAYSNVTAASSSVAWGDSNLAGISKRFYRLIENGPFTNVFLNADSLAQQILNAGTTASQEGAGAVYIASQLQGGLQLITNGTLTQTASSWTYSSTPSDRLAIQYLSGANPSYYIKTMVGDFTGDAAQFLRNNHDFRFRVVSTGLIDMDFVNIINGCSAAGSAQGTIISGGVLFTVNLSAGGQYCSNTGGGYTELTDDHTITGTISTPGLSMTVNQRRYFYIISSSSQDAWTAEDWISNTITLGTDVYQWSNVHKKKSFTNGHPSHIDPSQADIEWTATGSVLKNGGAYGTYQYYYNPADLYVRFLLVLPTYTVELEKYSR